MPSRVFLPLLLLAYLVAGALYAVYTPPWQAPDEPAHYNYVRQLAGGRLPVIEPGDYDQEYQSRVISSRFAPQYPLEPFEYEDWQPPLYYLLLTPVFWLSGGALLPLRLVSVVIGGGVVWLAFAVGQRVFAGQTWLALTAAALVAFVPQHMAMLSAVNNDGLAELWMAATLLLLVKEAESEPANGGLWQRPFWLGLWLGLGLLTKATALIMAPVIALFLLWRHGRRWRLLVRDAARLSGPVLLLGGLWWGRNLVVYGDLDVLGKAAHDAVVQGQPRTADWIAQDGLWPTAVALVRTTFQSFWGQFGWMAVPMPPWVYGPLLVATLLALGGLAWFWLGGDQSRRCRLLTGLLGSVWLFTILLFLAYNATFVQHQGRYLFPALIPLAVGATLGWATLARPLWRRWPSLRPLLPLGVAAALFALDLLALFCFIRPNL